LIRLFCGYDAREAVGFHAFVQSVVEHSSEPVAITPIYSGERRDGTNAFTYSRFLVPWMCGFEGFALWVDGADMLAAGDLADLWAEREGWYAAKVVKHDYVPKSDRKYVGTEMEAPNEAYPRKQWSSVILWDCEHYLNRVLTPQYVAEHDGAHLHRFGWIPDEQQDQIGELSVKWNWLCDEYGANTSAKLLHWTNGIPGFYAYRDSPHSEEWRAAVRRMQRGLA
jgi:hypothetical protein